jgi:hypothetical protein
MSGFYQPESSPEPGAKRIVVAPEVLLELAGMMDSMPRVFVDLAGLLAASSSDISASTNHAAFIAAVENFTDTWKAALLNTGMGAEDFAKTLKAAATHYQKTDRSSANRMQRVG